MERAARELVKRGCKVDVVTYHESLVGVEERREGFRVHRVNNPVPTHVNIVTWALTLNTELQRVAANIILETPIESRLVHALEWLCVPAAIQLKRAFGVPYVLSLYSTESERSVGGPLSGSITYLEKSGCLEASKVIVNSKTRAEAVQKTYAISRDNLAILGPDDHWIDELLEQYKSVETGGQKPQHKME
jgi:hypothetical protein